MIDRNPHSDEIVFVCDACPAALGTGEVSSIEASDEARMNGWTSREVAQGHVQHFCHNCTVPA